MYQHKHLTTNDPLTVVEKYAFGLANFTWAPFRKQKMFYIKIFRIKYMT